MRKDGVVPGRWLLVVWLAVLAPSALQAGSLEFRSEGFFASPDARAKFFREPWRYAPHLDVDGVLAVNIVGPILQPGTLCFPATGRRRRSTPASGS